MLQFYNGPLADLSPNRILTDLGQLWCADPSKRRYLRKAGVDEATVRGERGRYPFVLAYLDHISGKEKERAVAELAALRLAPGMICYPEDLWDGAARRLSEGWQIADRIAALNRAAKEETGEAAVGVLLPIFCDLAEAREEIDSIEAAVAVDLEELYRPSPNGAAGDDLNAAIERAERALDAFARQGCRHAYLRIERGFPPCLRQREEEISRIWRTDLRRRSPSEADALASAILFALLPKLRARGMTLLLQVGAVAMGDGFADAGCDARSIGEVASRLSASGGWPSTLLLPMTAHAAMALPTLCGIFPSVDGRPAIAVKGDVRVVERGMILLMLIPRSSCSDAE